MFWAGIQQTKDNREQRIQSYFLYVSEDFTNKQNSDILFTESVAPLTLSLYITDTARQYVVREDGGRVVLEISIQTL